MKSDAMSKLSASCIVLVMLLSSLVLVPGNSESQTSSTKTIYVPVLSGGLPVTNAWVNLTEVHTGTVIAAQYSSTWTAYTVTNAPSGMYRVDVQATDYYDELSADEIRYDGMSNVTADAIMLTAFPYKQYTWNVTVRDSDNQLAKGAVVGFYDPVAREWVSKGVTNSLGYVQVAMFQTAVLGDVDLVVVRSGSETYVQQVLVNSNQTMPVNLAKSKLVSSYVKRADGNPALNVVAYLINTDSSIPWVKRVLRTTGPYVAFDAYAGNFILVVDAEGDAAEVQSLTVAGDMPLTIYLDPQTQRLESTAIAYTGSDFNAFTLSVNTAWSYDEAYPGLMYNDMGSLRMQVDLMLGDGNGDLTASEALAFYDAVNDWGTEYVTSDRLLVLNETAYVSDLAIAGYTMDLAASAVTDQTSVNYAYTCGYQAPSLPIDGGFYDALVYAKYDTSEVNHTYSIDLPLGYERVTSSSGSFTVTGYSYVEIDPAKATGGPAIISMKFEASEGPSAGAGIEYSSVSFIVRDDEGNITKYIVRVEANVTFSAEDSVDPNGNPMTYTWDFDDGTLPVTTSNETYVYNYSTAALERTVNLTVEDSAGMLDWAEITVVCDNAAPVPVIQVKDKTINMTDFSITVNQTELITFNGTDSYDYFVQSYDDLGMVDYVQFDYGDNTSSARISSANNEQNVTHSYKTADTYNLTMKVVDVVGHNATVLLKVHVLDTTAPVAGFTVKNATGGTTLVENATIMFNATDTVDNYDDLENMTFHWYFGDGAWDNETGPVTNHTYQRFGKLTISLNVTDTAGNYDVLSRVITINSGPRPKMMVDRVYYSTDGVSFKPGNFTEDATGYILVNMTNKGTAPATDIVVKFYRVNQDGTQDEISGTYEIVNATTLLPIGSDSVLVGGKVQVRFECSMKNPGTYSIKVVVTAHNQSDNTTHTATGSYALTVEEAAWKEYALWGGVLAVIILVPALIYVTRRLSKREKKGPRREKRSEEGQ